QVRKVGAMAIWTLFPAMAITPQYFLNRRGAATGLTVAGSSLGALVFPIVLSELLETVWFGWYVRICGFIMMPALIISSPTVRARPLRERVVSSSGRHSRNRSIFARSMTCVLCSLACSFYSSIYLRLASTMI
ncbi:tat pathway signal sequence, partial [Colletotrichum graminicola M1.001]